MKVQLRKIATIIGAGVLCFAMTGVNLGCNDKDSKKTDKSKLSADSAVVKVVVAEVKECPFEDWGTYSADLRGIDDANLTAPAQGGRVSFVRDVGAHVKAGESLCQIDSEKYEASLEAAKAQVEVAKGDLERAKVNVEKGSLGRSAIDGANLAFQNARVNLANAQRANDDCHCQAPFDGVLVSRNIDKYQSVSPGITTVRISRIDRLEAIIAIPENEAFSYTEGMKTQFYLLQHPEKIFEGTLTNLDRAVDTHSRTVLARITVVNRDGTLRPGMVGHANILRKKYTNAIVVPSTSLLRLQNGIYAMVAEGGIARQRIIAVGATTTDSTLVSSGLRAGDKLIVTGGFQVSDGTRVSY